MLQHFASESVCAGHPDKICDQISDAILDAALRQDPYARTAVETMVTSNRVVLSGEVNTRAQLDFAQIAREQIQRLGYVNPAWNFSDASEIEVYIHGQSPEIAIAVDAEGAGDQGLMFGYACKETKQLMPLPIMISHALSRGLDQARESGKLPYLRPDGKVQVVIGYENSKPLGVEHLTIAVPHDEAVELAQVKQDIYQALVVPTLNEYGYQILQQNFVLNGTGVWHLPGPSSDAGLTGRKIAVDTYGGYARMGGGCFSGKDPSKVDRSGAYAARFIAKNIVAHDLADRAEVGLAYYIGGKIPVMLDINTFGTGKKGDQVIADFAKNLIDLSVSGISSKLDLRRPIYLQTAAYGHFGRDGLPWEQIVP